MEVCVPCASAYKFSILMMTAEVGGQMRKNSDCIS
jgi:hypothetical protein